MLATPRTPIELDWEVRDLLKTASRQAASFLGQMRATEALLEARKFDAFNRMSAFVVHDLKNLVAQLSLMLQATPSATATIPSSSATCWRRSSTSSSG